MGSTRIGREHGFWKIIKYGTQWWGRSNLVSVVEIALTTVSVPDTLIMALLHDRSPSALARTDGAVLAFSPVNPISLR